MSRQPGRRAWGSSWGSSLQEHWVFSCEVGLRRDQAALQKHHEAGIVGVLSVQQGVGLQQDPCGCMFPEVCSSWRAALRGPVLPLQALPSLGLWPRSARTCGLASPQQPTPLSEQLTKQPGLCVSPQTTSELLVSASRHVTWQQLIWCGPLGTWGWGTS